MALSMLGSGLQQITQMVNQTVKKAVAQAGQGSSADPKDRVEIGGQPEPAAWKPFPPVGGFPGFGTMAGPQGPQAPQIPQTMEQADEAAAREIEQMVQLAGSRPQEPIGSGGITNFAAQAMDQQLMICDVKAARAIQRQTQLATGDKAVKLNNPKTQAALARMGKGFTGNFCRQAAAQQQAAVGGGQSKPPTTQPSGQSSPASAVLGGVRS